NPQRTQSRVLFREQHRRHRLRRPVRPLLVDLLEPGSELLKQIFQVVEPTDLEEAPLHPADEILDGTFLISAPRLAELDPEAVVQSELRERPVPDDRRLLRMNDDRLRIVEYHGERHAPTLLQGGEEGTTERLDLLIG